jgi:hypothetical protein
MTRSSETTPVFLRRVTIFSREGFLLLEHAFAMRIFAIVVCVAGCAACASSKHSTFNSSGPDSASDDSDAGDDGDNGGVLIDPDAGDVTPCKGLKCQQVQCSGSATTTVSGRVFDPAGKNPLYNVVVYVPNAPLDAIKHGPVCDTCGAIVSGLPVVTALTDPTGKFTLKNVPVGPNIPLVMQVGKWRRKMTIPNVNACADNPITDTDKTRLPRNKSEGDMPLIALTGGCDPIHVLVQKIGVDPLEMTNEFGNGMVHVFAGKDGYNGGVSNATDAYAFWGDLSKMMKYDVIINECECTPYPRDTYGPAYDNTDKYLAAGGREFFSHYHLNHLGPSSENGGKAAPDLQSAAQWTLWGGSSGGGSIYDIDTSFPKGKAMDDWFENLKTASGWGPSIKTSPKGQIHTSSVGDIKAAISGISQQWIYPDTKTSVAFLSFNTPTTAPSNKRCGRAVATDMHVGNGVINQMSEQEAALEFMFFDLAACVSDDGDVPKPPPPQ